MDDEPRISKSAWTWAIVIGFYLALGLVALLQGCSPSMIDKARDACHGAGGQFAAQRGTATAPDGEQFPAIVMVCVFKGRAI